MANKVELRNKAMQLVQARYQKALDYQKPYFSNFNEYYKLYRSIIDKNKQAYAGRANLFIPYIFQTIETIIPRLIGNKPKIDIVPREPIDIAKAEISGKLVDYQSDMMNLRSKLKMYVKNALIYGTAIIKVYWRYEEDNGQVLYDGPDIDLVDLFDFYIDPDATTINDADYIIHRAAKNLEELKNNKNYNIPNELEAEVSSDEYKVQRDAAIGLAKPKDADKKKVELLEYWGKFDIDGDGIQEDCLIVLANRNHVIRAEENPYYHKKKPFVALFDTQIPNEFFAIGEVEPLQSLQYELNDVRNQRMDNVTLILNRMWKVAKGADVDEEDLVSQAGGVIHCGDINGVMPIDTPDVTISAYNEETMIKQDMQQTSGVTDYTKGASSTNVKGQSSLDNTTATGIMLLQEAGNARFKYKLDNLEDSLREIGKQILALDQQFIQENVTVRLFGDSGYRWETVSPEDIKGEFDIQVETGSTQPMNKSIRRAEARELLAAVAPFVQYGVRLDYFIRNLLKQYDLSNPEEAFLQPQSPVGLEVPEELAEAAGGPAGAFFGGNVGNRGNVPQQRLGNPNPTPGKENPISQIPAG